jgi:hypothetical protein
VNNCGGSRIFLKLWLIPIWTRGGTGTVRWRERVRGDIIRETIVGSYRIIYQIDENSSPGIEAQYGMGFHRTSREAVEGV